MHVKGVERVFLRLPNWLGDSLMARPLTGVVRAAFPAARIVASGPAPLLELLAGDRAWDVALPWPAAPAAVRAAAGGAIDSALVLPPSFSSAWHAWRAGARARIGFSADARSLLLTHAVRRPDRGNLHLGREYLLLAGALGVDAGALGVSALPLADAPLPDGAGARGGFAVLAPGAAYGPAKRWPLPRWIALARELSARGLEVLACGGAGEAEACSARSRGRSSRTAAWAGA